MKIGISLLKPDPTNARKHSKRNLESIKGSLSRFGQQKPIVVDADNVIIAGNGTWEAAKSLGWKEIDVIKSKLKGSDRTAYAIADNQTAILAEWDDEVLSKTLDALSQDEDIDELVTGFDQDEIDRMLNSGDAVEDEVPEVGDGEPVTRAGDVWVCGRHRVICGDATESECVSILLAGATPFMMVTDPPYGVSLDQSWRDKALGDKAMGPGNSRVIENDNQADWSEAWSLFNGDVAYVWHAGRYSDVVIKSLNDNGFDTCQQLIWNKSVMVMGRSDYHFKHEPCWYVVRNGKPHGWIGDRNQVTVIDAASPNHIMSGSTDDKTSHPTQKPINCMCYLIRNHAGEVYDPFLGSGTTLIACEQLGRTCYGIEISPKYVDVICKRYMAFTGDSPVRESDGAIFSQLIDAESIE